MTKTFPATCCPNCGEIVGSELDGLGREICYACSRVRPTWREEPEEHTNGHLQVAPAPAPIVEATAPFPVHALPTILQDLVSAGARSVVVPPEYIAVPLLVTAGIALGNAMEIEVKPGWREGPNLFAAIVGDPGSGKTPAVDLATRPIHRIQLRLTQQYQDLAKTFEAELKAWEKLSRGERDDKPDPPTFRHVLTSDATVEALAPMLGNGKGIALLKDELVGWVRSMDQYRAGGKGADRQHFLSMWSRSTIKVDRKSAPVPIIVSRPCLAVVGGIQPDLLGDLADVARREDGFLDRLLWAFPDPIPSHWSDDVVPEAVLRAGADLFEWLYLLESHSDSEGNPAPLVVRFDAQAKALWREWYGQHLGETEQESFPPYLRGPWAKMPSQLARLALILHACLTQLPDAVTEVTLGAAIELVDYFKAHARRAHRVIRRESKNVTLKLLEALKASRPVGLTQSQLTRDVFQRNLPSGVISAALFELEQAGIVGRARSNDGIGRPSTSWLLI